MPNLPGLIPPYKPLQKLIDAFNQLRDCVESLYPRQSLDVLTSHTALGVSRQCNPAAAVTAGNWYQGEYSVFIAYTAGQGVKVSSGLVAGLYICTVNVILNPPGFPGDPPQAPLNTAPWLGNNWTQIGQIADQSNWI